jgi:hypothetical protein
LQVDCQFHGAARDKNLLIPKDPHASYLLNFLKISQIFKECQIKAPFHLTSSKGLQISKFRHTVDKNGADQSNSELIVEKSTNREQQEIQNAIEQHVPSGKLKSAGRAN